MKIPLFVPQPRTLPNYISSMDTNAQAIFCITLSTTFRHCSVQDPCNCLSPMLHVCLIRMNNKAHVPYLWNLFLCKNRIHRDSQDGDANLIRGLNHFCHYARGARGFALFRFTNCFSHHIKCNKSGEPLTGKAGGKSSGDLGKSTSIVVSSSLLLSIIPNRDVTLIIPHTTLTHKILTLLLYLLGKKDNVLVSFLTSETFFSLCLLSSINCFLCKAFSNQIV